MKFSVWLEKNNKEQEFVFDIYREFSKQFRSRGIATSLTWKSPDAWAFSSFPEPMNGYTEDIIPLYVIADFLEERGLIIIDKEEIPADLKQVPKQMPFNKVVVKVPPNLIGNSATT